MSSGALPAVARSLALRFLPDAGLLAPKPPGPLPAAAAALSSSPDASP